MPRLHLSVAERVSLLHSIFADFGVPVEPNSTLDYAIRNEFGPGKRSKLNQALQEYNKHTDAALLSVCIGAELQYEFAEPELLAIGRVMSDRLPAVLEIVDIRNQTAKRERLLEQIITHFYAKLPVTAESERLLRMLDAARSQLHVNLQAQAIGQVVEHVGVVFACQDLQRCGTILQALIPALIALDHAALQPSQLINKAVHALRVMADELQVTNLRKAANIIDYIHWLAQVNLPQLGDHSTIEQVLKNLDIPFGNMTATMLRDKSRQVGLHDQELLQILITNQRHAATCGIIAKFAREIACPELEKIGVSGLCILTLRQSFQELKTSNLNAVNFSESCGIMLSGLGTLTGNAMVSKLGKAVTNGVKTYAGLMAIPGGVTIALPLAICSVLGGLLLHSKKSGHTIKNKIVQQTVNEIYLTQRVMSWHFADLQSKMTEQQRELLSTIDTGFAQMVELVGRWQLVEAKNWRHLEDIQHTISSEFSDLYLEYIRDPLEQLRFYADYDQFDMQELPKIKLKLNMWLLYKSKGPKANGRTQTDLALQRCTTPDAVLGLLNRYVNLTFAQTLPEELPHIPTWLLAAEAYIEILRLYQDPKELRILTDIISVGTQVLTYIADLANNLPLWQQLSMAIAALEQERDSIIAALRPPAESNRINKTAQPSPWELQLERFTPLPWDLHACWDRYNLAAEYGIAEHYKIGTIHANYTVLPDNQFTEVHLPNSAEFLPTEARFIRFKIKIFFTMSDRTEPQLLATSMHIYDLGTLRNRFEQYYRPKFQYPLRHSNYDWISIDGMQNQVTGQPVTSTHKLIDYSRLAQIYQTWFTQATLQNVQVSNNDLLILQLQAQIRVRREREQANFEQAKLTHARLPQVQDKLAVYQAVQRGLQQLVNGDLQQRVAYTVAKLRLLLPSCMGSTQNHPSFVV